MTSLRSWKLAARIFHQAKLSCKQYPPLGIAAAVQPERRVGNERRQRNGYSESGHEKCRKNHVVKERLTQRNGVGKPESVPSEFSSYRQYTIPTALRYSENEAVTSP
ncbi:predicted protein [Sclerotinia sclerotiorum 1980 UF-70]|uniref:Uncharacterized protein n=1 Tax=Sclerotinia sclerotiorum (strain ATCC 18683 / 1980 / Ss-1) TaxID=665079 RepID=A7E9F7_SCLS1|nr:predicted protein [Sclerotinia sclerotiorum 1980 UF-70]EDN97009.1 predicted protein [Sclerotinia sclerotiorum 1980 UF-70]